MPSIEKNKKINTKEFYPVSDVIANENSVDESIYEIGSTQEPEPPTWDSACRL